MAFGVATVVTNKGKAMLADRVRTSPSTYTSSPKWAAMGTGATTAARTAVAADTALSAEVEFRISGTETNQTSTSGVTGDTYQNVATITATAGRAVDEFGLFDSSSSGAASMFLSATQNVINLNSSDSIQFTARVILN